MLIVLVCFACSRAWRTCMLTCMLGLRVLRALIVHVLTCSCALRARILSVPACLRVYLIISFACIWRITKIMVWQLKNSRHIYKCIAKWRQLEIVKGSNKFHCNLSRSSLNPLIPKSRGCQTGFQNFTENDLESGYKSSIFQILKVGVTILEQ